MNRKERNAFARELEKRFERHLADVRAEKLQGKRVTVFGYDIYRTSTWRKHRPAIERHVRQLFFELQNAGPFFDRDGHELTFEVTQGGTLYVWRHPKRTPMKEE